MKTKDQYWLDRISAAVANERTAARRVDQLVARAMQTGIAKTQIARAIGVHRSTLYRPRLNRKAAR